MLQLGEKNDTQQPVLHDRLLKKRLTNDSSVVEASINSSIFSIDMRKGREKVILSVDPVKTKEERSVVI